MSGSGVAGFELDATCSTELAREPSRKVLRIVKKRDLTCCTKIAVHQHLRHFLRGDEGSILERVQGLFVIAASRSACGSYDEVYSVMVESVDC